MEQFGIRAVIGKGGMGPKTLKYCQKVGAVYFHAIGGAAQVLAECVVDVPDVHLAEELGSPEAIWEFRVVKFPVVVTWTATAIPAREGAEGLHRTSEQDSGLSPLSRPAARSAGTKELICRPTLIRNRPPPGHPAAACMNSTWRRC